MFKRIETRNRCGSREREREREGNLKKKDTVNKNRKTVSLKNKKALIIILAIIALVGIFSCVMASTEIGQSITKSIKDTLFSSETSQEKENLIDNEEEIVKLESNDENIDSEGSVSSDVSTLSSLENGNEINTLATGTSGNATYNIYGEEAFTEEYSVGAFVPYNSVQYSVGPGFSTRTK